MNRRSIVSVPWSLLVPVVLAACSKLQTLDTSDAGIDAASSGDADVIDPTLAVPAPLRPWNGETTGSVFSSRAKRPRFQWSAVTDATSYELLVDDSCPATQFSSCSLPSPEVSIRGILSPTYTPTQDLPVRIRSEIT